jgi:hypothetical protein
VARPIIISVVTSMVLRPRRSPKCPKITPPSGRAKNPMANEPNEAILDRNGSSPGKYSLSNTNAAAVP